MRQVRYHEPRDAREGPERKHRSERPSRQGKEEALRQQLPHETSPAGADGQPERHLFVAHGSSREQKIGNVRASNQQHESESAEDYRRSEERRVGKEGRSRWST